MNFKPTLWKGIVSIVTGLGSNFIFMNVSGGCNGIYCYYPHFLNYKFLWVFVFVTIYIIWSLFEKQKKRKKK